MAWHPAARETSKRHRENNKEEFMEYRREYEAVPANKERKNRLARELTADRGMSIASHGVPKVVHERFERVISEFAPDVQHALLYGGAALDKKLAELGVACK